MTNETIPVLRFVGEEHGARVYRLVDVPKDEAYATMQRNFANALAEGLKQGILSVPRLALLTLKKP